MGGRGFLTGILLGAVVSGGGVHYYYQAQFLEPIAESPSAPPPAKASRYDYDDILRNKGNVPVRLPPQAKPEDAAPSGFQSSPMKKKASAGEKPADKSGAAASVRLPPQAKPEDAAPSGFQSSPMKKKASAGEKPADKSGTAASVRLPPQAKPANAALNGSQPSPVKKKASAGEKPADKSGTSASAAEAAAEQTSIKPKQTADAGPSEPARALMKKQSTPSVSQAGFIVQVQTLPQLEAAQALQRRLKSLGYDSMIQTAQLTDDGGYLVWMGPFDRLRADSIQMDLKQNAMASVLVVPVNR